jgi:hypothetical protein
MKMDNIIRVISINPFLVKVFFSNHCNIIGHSLFSHSLKCISLLYSKETKYVIHILILADYQQFRQFKKSKFTYWPDWCISCHAWELFPNGKA